MTIRTKALMAAVAAMMLGAAACTQAEQERTEAHAEAAADKTADVASQAGEVIEGGAMKAAQAVESGAGKVADKLETEQAEAAAETNSAPEYAFRDRTGTAVRFSAFQGKVVVVNLWAMWCAPCKAEMPTLQALAKAYETNEDLVVLPINVDATPEAAAEARRFLASHAPLPFYSDAKFQLPFEFPGKGAMPQTIVLDRQGRIRAVMRGEADWSSQEARALIDAILAEGAAPPPA